MWPGVVERRGMYHWNQSVLHAFRAERMCKLTDPKIQAAHVRCVITHWECELESICTSFWTPRIGTYPGGEGFLGRLNDNKRGSTGQKYRFVSLNSEKASRYPKQDLSICVSIKERSAGETHVSRERIYVLCKQQPVVPLPYFHSP